MTDLYEREARQDERRELYRSLVAILDLPVVPVRIEDGKVVPVVAGRPSPSTIDRFFGRGRAFRDSDAALVVRESDPIVVLRGPLLRDDAPAFRDPLTGERASIFRRSARPLPMSFEHVALTGYVLVSGNPSEWFCRLPETFVALPDAPIVSTKMETQ
jgi:hypothetical protein